jgi:DNA-binding MarR family transcriptional regulator
MADSNSDAETSRSGLADPRRMRDLLPSRLARLVAVAGAPVTRWCEGQFGISRREWRVIATLAVEGTMFSSQLAQHLELDRARTSRALGNLELQGLIARAHAPGNARQVQVALTGKGREVFEQLWPVVRAHHLRLLEAFTAEQVAMLDQLLTLAMQQAQRIGKNYTDLPKADRRLGRGARRVGGRIEAPG